MMKKISIIVLLSAVTIITLSYYKHSEYKSVAYSLAIQPKLQSGDLKYRIYLFGIFPVGEAVFSDQGIKELNGVRVRHLTASASSSTIFSSFFSAQALLDSFLDLQDENPLLFRQRLSVTGKEDSLKEITYDQKQQVMTLEGVRREILPGTQDPLSAMFRLRGMDFDKSNKIKMNINTNQKNYLLEGTAEERTLSLVGERCKLITAKAQIRRRDKNPYHKSMVSFVLFKGGENVPVLIKVFASGVMITAKLSDPYLE
ncbi:DUF3108 domain-containing protein [Candidatus Omnitrophota bacterium]